MGQIVPNRTAGDESAAPAPSGTYTTPNRSAQPACAVRGRTGTCPLPDRWWPISTSVKPASRHASRSAGPGRRSSRGWRGRTPPARCGARWRRGVPRRAAPVEPPPARRRGRASGARSPATTRRWPSRPAGERFGRTLQVAHPGRAAPARRPRARARGASPAQGRHRRPIRHGGGAAGGDPRPAPDVDDVVVGTEAGSRMARSASAGARW